LPEGFIERNFSFAGFFFLGSLIKYLTEMNLQC